MRYARLMVLPEVALSALVVIATGCSGQKPIGGGQGSGGQADADGGTVPPTDGPASTDGPAPMLDPGTAVSLTVPPAHASALT